MAKTFTAAELLDRAWAKLQKKHVISSLDTDVNAIVSLAEKLGEQEKLDDFSKDAKGNDIEYENPVLIVAYVKETDRYRFIVIPSSEMLLGIPAVAERAFEMLVASVFRNAKSPDSSAAKFQSPISAVLPRIDMKPFLVLAPKFLDALHAKAGKGASMYKQITVKILRDCLASEASATSFFPKIPATFWDRAIDAMRAAAEKNGYSTLIFDHWAGSRKLVTDQSAPVQEIDLGDFANYKLEPKAGIPSTDADVEAADAPAA